MSFTKTVGGVVGVGAGLVGAYAKHAVVGAGVHTSSFGVAAYDAAKATFAEKDAVLAARRDELRAERAARTLRAPSAAAQQALGVIITSA